MTGRAVAACLQPLEESKTPYAALKLVGIAATSVPSNVGQGRAPHCGILYRWKKLEVRLFEMHAHKFLSDAPARPGFVWIEPTVPDARLRLVIQRARLVFECHKENAVPYGFTYRKSSFDERGGLRLGPGEVGFTCATIVAAIFEAENLPLIEPLKWPAPDDADKAVRRAFVDGLRMRDGDHAKLLATEIESPRISPEEVVAAAAAHPEIGTFDTLQEGAAVVRGRIGT